MPKIQTPEMRPNPMKTGLAASSHHHFYPHKSAKTHYMNVDVYPFDKPGDERVTITIHAEQVSSPDIPLAKAPPGAPDRGRDR